MKSNLKMIIFSDLHYYLCEGEKRKSNKKLTDYSIPVLNKLIDKINTEYKPDVCIHLGDLIQDTKNHDTDIENLQYICNQFKNIKYPFYTAIGNHDLLTMNSRREVEQILGYEHSTFSININGYHLIMLGSDVRVELGISDGGIYKTQYISNEDLKWLENDLQSTKFPCIIFSHFGIAEDEMKGHYAFEKAPEDAVFKNRKEIKEIINKHQNVISVFSGHQHWTKKLNENGIPYYIVGSLVENINDDGVPDGVYLEVDIQDGKINVAEHHIRI